MIMHDRQRRVVAISGAIFFSALGLTASSGLAYGQAADEEVDVQQKPRAPEEVRLEEPGPDDLDGEAVIDDVEEEDDEGEGALARMADLFRTPALRIGLVTQVTAQTRLAREETNGLLIRAARLQLQGALEGGWRYFVQTEFVLAPSLFDLILGWSSGDELIIQAGFFRVPFSGELEVNLPALLFIDRAQVVNALAPGRQLGVAAQGAVAEGLFSYGVGIFNGNGRQFAGNDDNAPLVTSRLAVAPPLGEQVELQIGASGAWRRDDTEVRQGDTVLLGADVDLDVGPLLVNGEVIWSERLDEDAPPGEDADPWGYQLTAGAEILPETLWALLRWDSFQPAGPEARSDLLIAGINYRPVDGVLFRLNYQLPTSAPAPENHWVRLNLQVVF